MKKIIWILVNCNSAKEAKTIGIKILKLRLASCFEIVPRYLAVYWWPPKQKKIETSQGATLIFETFLTKYRKAAQQIKKFHSDDLPFIGYLEVKGLANNYAEWMKYEIE